MRHSGRERDGFTGETHEGMSDALRGEQPSTPGSVYRTGPALIVAIAALSLLCGCVSEINIGEEIDGRDPRLQYMSPVGLSPDGRWLVLGTPDGIVDTHTGELFPIANHEVFASLVSWAPGSQRFVFWGESAEQGQRPVLCRLDPVNCRVPDVTAFDQDFVRSPLPIVFVSDSTMIAGVSLSWDGPAGVVRASLDDNRILAEGEPTIFCESNDWSVHALSTTRDYERVLVILSDAIWSVDTGTLSARKLLDTDQVPAGAGVEIESGVARPLLDVYPATGKNSMYAVIYTQAPETKAFLIRVNMQNGDVAQVDVAPDVYPVIAANPPGTKLVGAQHISGGHLTPDTFFEKNRSQIFIAESDLSERTAVTSGEYCDRNPIWDGANDRILFTRDFRELWSVPVEGGEPIRIFTADGPDE